MAMAAASDGLPVDVSHSDGTTKSDLVWKGMLPPDYESIAENAYGGPIRYKSFKEVYDRLTNHILLGDGLEGVGIDEITGGFYRSYAARRLNVVWGADSTYWEWMKEEGGSRFEEVAFLRSVCWLEVSGEIKALLPPGAYTLSWALKFVPVYGKGESWSENPLALSVTKGDDIQLSTMELPPRPQEEHPRMKWMNDGWFEYNAGEFTVSGPEAVELRFDMKEVTSQRWKNGLYVDGVILRQQMQASVVDEQIDGT